MTLVKSTASSGAASRSPRPSVLVLTTLAVTLGACGGGSTQPPAVAPQAVLVEPTASVSELADQADQNYWFAVDAQQRGDADEAQEYFDRAVEVFLHADIPAGEEDAFRTAFNDLVTRVHAQQLDEFQVAAEAEATDLPEEEIPVLSEAEIELLRSRMADTLPEMPKFTVPIPMDNPRVIEAVRYLSQDREEVIAEGLARGQAYLPLIREVFTAEGVPLELAFIPLIESLYKPYVRSRASAVGLWQLMAPTARLYGLRVDWYVDERRDPVKSTKAIARFILDYYREFDDWHLAIAAYNGGKGRVGRALQRTGTEDFWTLSEVPRSLPRETREFVPKILAAILMGTDPEAYGLRFIAEPEFRYDEVSIDSMTDLQVVAEAAGTTLEVIQDLNPQLLRRTTPNMERYTMRVPEGSGDRFRVAYAAIPESERVRVVEHRIRTGETLSRIADAYDTSVAAISDLNGIRNRHSIRAGHTLLIPAGQPSAGTVAGAPRAESGRATGEQVAHTVRRGENLSRIAGRYGTSVSAIKQWNSMSSDRIYEGDRLTVYYGTTSSAPTAAAPPAGVAAAPATTSARDAAPAVASSSTDYTIRRGDTLIGIARMHGVRVQDLRNWNGLNSDRIYPGRSLTIQMPAGQAVSSYTIRRGDTLAAIARRFGVSIDQLCAWNDITPRTTIYPGNRLTIRTPAAQ
ncbi:MAG: LysM peptidoglycan-binding domain-containing protein [Acidobacteria bacterium]|nr:LysM peptidoglycan-binding domain-containing protein [Acidobacteriota bacterium]